MASVSASTKRSPSIASGKRGSPTTKLASVSCTPLDPVTEEVRRRVGLDTPHELLMCYAVGSVDIKEGDILVVGSSEYPIKAVGEWSASPQGSDGFIELVVEELKR